MTFSEWLERDLKPHLHGDTAEYMRLLRSRTQHLDTLINGMLEFARADRDPIEPTLVDTRELIEPSRAQSVDLPTFRTEREPLQRVFHILLDNAVRYATDASHITVSARDLGARYEFAVSDDGPGVPARLQDRIWLLFESAQPPDADGSTGVGLAIARKIVERRGGRIWVDATAERGATFRFTWPRELHQ
jgi:signal transduction histidine kinase